MVPSVAKEKFPSVTLPGIVPGTARLVAQSLTTTLPQAPRNSRYLLNRKLGRPQSRSWFLGGENSLLAFPGIEQRFREGPGRSLVTALTELSRFCVGLKFGLSP
jgi:hypothetical protein